MAFLFVSIRSLWPKTQRMWVWDCTSSSSISNMRRCQRPLSNHFLEELVASFLCRESQLTHRLGRLRRILCHSWSIIQNHWRTTQCPCRWLVLQALYDDMRHKDLVWWAHSWSHPRRWSFCLRWISHRWLCWQKCKYFQLRSVLVLWLASTSCSWPNLEPHAASPPVKEYQRHLAVHSRCRDLHRGSNIASWSLRHVSLPQIKPLWLLRPGRSSHLWLLIQYGNGLPRAQYIDGIP